MINKKIFIIINFLFVFLFSGCSFSETLKNIDGVLGEQVFEGNISTSSVKEDTEKIDEIDIANLTFRDLTKEQRFEIDEWLKKNGYNRYGDSAGVIYAGGTPLFDETGGETIDRFDYILQKQPQILQQVFE